MIKNTSFLGKMLTERNPTESATLYFIVSMNGEERATYQNNAGDGATYTHHERSLDAGSDYEFTVAFTDQGVKRLMLSYAKLEKISNIEEHIDDDFIKDEYYESEI